MSRHIISLVFCFYMTNFLCLAPYVVADTATYQLTVYNGWNQEHHKPGAPLFESVVQPHFSHLGGGTHNANLDVWSVGGLSSPGMKKMQETGWIDEPSSNVDLKNEFDSHIANGVAHSFLNYPIPNPWFPAGTETILEFEITDTHPLVTLVSMLGPSPDWFIGVDSLNLREGDLWREVVEVDLYTHDGGTRSRDDQFALFGPLETPQKPIALITDTDDTLLKGSLPIGKFTFELLSVDPPTLLGDFNFNGYVDGADFLKWQRGRSPNSLSLSDLDTWKTHYGEGPSDEVVQAISIPEPTTWLLVCWWMAPAALGRSFSSKERSKGSSNS